MCGTYFSCRLITSMSEQDYDKISLVVGPSIDDPTVVASIETVQ